MSMNMYRSSISARGSLERTRTRTPPLPCCASKTREGTMSIRSDVGRKRQWWSFLLSSFASMTVLAHQPFAAQADVDAGQLFGNTCAGCHAGGGNIVNRSATLRFEDLQKYGLTGPDQIFEVVYWGRGSMPGYGESCEPKGKCTFGKRLADEEVKALAEFVDAKARAGW